MPLAGFEFYNIFEGDSNRLFGKISQKVKGPFIVPKRAIAPGQELVF